MKRIMKRSTVKKIIASVVFFLFGAGMICGLSYCFHPQTIEEQTVKDVKPYGLLAEPEDSLDVIIYGDSEAYSAFSPVQMWNEYGFTSYVCASSNQYITLTYSFIRETLIHQKPKVVFLETNAIYRKMNSSDAFLSTMQSIFPVFEYHNLWKNFDPLNMNENDSDYCWQDGLKGFKYMDIVNNSNRLNYMWSTTKVQKFPQDNLPYVEAICDFCKEQGVQLVFVSAPSTVHWNYAKHNAMVKLTAQLGVPYIDLNLEKDIGINWYTDTCDGGDHVNYFGATKVSTFFGKYVQQTFGLADHRDDANYDDWNALKQKYDEVTARSTSQYPSNVVKNKED